MNGIGLAVLLVALTTVSFTAGWVFRDALARGLPLRRALTWAALSSQEWPLFLLLYRRIRPRRVQGDNSPATGTGAGRVGVA
jgi:hypothetical protein